MRTTVRICDEQSGQNLKCFENIHHILDKSWFSPTCVREWLMENDHFVSAVVFVWSTCGSRCHGFKEQPEVGKAERETTSENEDNDCFCTKPESHAWLNKSGYCHREAKPQHKKKALYKQQVLQSLYCTQVWSTRSIYMVALAKPETCCHLLRLWASCLKSRDRSFCLRKMVCRKSIMSAYKMSRGL